jgi:hypothetical protein
MRLFCILLVLLLIAGPVAAISANPASVQSAVKVTTAKPLVTMAVQRTLVQQPAGTAPVSPMLYISSVPSGAAVTADGTARGVTPLTIGLYPGTHTIVLSLDGYKDYTTTVTLADGEKKAFEAQLVRALSAGTLRANVSAIGTRETPLSISHTILTDAVVTLVPPAICTSDQMCLTLEDAAAIYAPGWGYKVTDVCGYAAAADNSVIKKYCTSGTSNVGNPPAYCASDEKCLTLADAAATYAPGWGYTEGSVCDYVTFTGNQTIIPKYCTVGSPKLTMQQAGVKAQVTGLTSLVPVSPQPVLPGVTRQVLGAKRQAGVLDSFLGFFSGIFTTKPSCLNGQAACGGKCIDVMNDSLNCGSCDYTCFDPAVCQGGECVEGYHFPTNPYEGLL